LIINTLVGVTSEAANRARAALGVQLRSFTLSSMLPDITASKRVKFI